MSQLTRRLDSRAAYDDLHFLQYDSNLYGLDIMLQELHRSRAGYIFSNVNRDAVPDKGWYKCVRYSAIVVHETWIFSKQIELKPDQLENSSVKWWNVWAAFVRAFSKIHTNSEGLIPPFGNVPFGGQQLIPGVHEIIARDKSSRSNIV